MNKIVTLVIFPTMIVRLCVVTKPSTRWTQCCQFCTTLVLSTCRDYENDELLAAFDRAEIRPYQFVPRAQTVIDKTDESGGSEESDDEVGAVKGSGITRGARSERTGNRSSLDLPLYRLLSYKFQETINKTTEETKIAGQQRRGSAGESHVAAPETHPWRSH